MAKMLCSWPEVKLNDNLYRILRYWSETSKTILEEYLLINQQANRYLGIS